MWVSNAPNNLKREYEPVRRPWGYAGCLSTTRIPHAFLYKQRGYINKQAIVGYRTVLGLGTGEFRVESFAHVEGFEIFRRKLMQGNLLGNSQSCQYLYPIRAWRQALTSAQLTPYTLTS